MRILMPIQSPAIAAGERWDGGMGAGAADGAMGMTGSNVVVGWAVDVLVAVGAVEVITSEGIGAVELSPTRLGSAAVVARARWFCDDE